MAEDKDRLAGLLGSMGGGEDEQRPEEAGGEAAMSMPAQTPDAAAGEAGPPVPVSGMRRRESKSLLSLKQTITPILFTSGVLCVGLVVLGLAAGRDEKSAFHFFREVGFMIPAGVVGAVLVGLGWVTMLQVSNELGLLAAIHRRGTEDAEGERR